MADTIFSVKIFIELSFSTNLPIAFTMFNDILFIEASLFANLLTVFAIFNEIWFMEPSFNASFSNILLRAVFLEISVAFIFSIILRKTTLIIRETAVLSEMKMSYLKRSAYQIAMRRADIIISQSDDMTVDLIKNFKVNKLKVVQIGNPICEP